LEETWPAIQREAKACGATVYFGDEANMRSDYHKGTTWGLKGQTPVVEKTGQRFSINMLSAISPRGALRFMLTEERVNATVFIAFLKRLLHGAEQPIFLILDGHPVHRSRAVRAFEESTQGKLKIFLLPGYSPDLNPDELVWHYLKRHRLARAMVETKAQLIEQARGVLRSMQKRVELLRSFFRETHVRYVINACPV
jgi:transposase